MRERGELCRKEGLSMVDLKELQRLVYQNKVDHQFNVTDVPFEFCLLMTEVAEAFRSRDTAEYGEELADIAIYLLGLAEIGGVDLEAEILKKMEKNRRRKYFQNPDGTWGKIEGDAE